MEQWVMVEVRPKCLSISTLADSRQQQGRGSISFGYECNKDCQLKTIGTEEGSKHPIQNQHGYMEALMISVREINVLTTLQNRV